MLDLALALDLELRTAARLAREAGLAVERIKGEGFSHATKADDSPVTRADLESDRTIRAGLAEAFPDDGILTEESKGLHRESSSGRTWIVDPLDGTRAFIAGTHDYAIHIGLVMDGDPVLGVVYEPSTGRMYNALRGVGAFLSLGTGGTVRQLRVSRRAEYASMPLVTSTHMKAAERQRVIALLGCVDGGAQHSVGYKVGMLVRGEADLYYSVHPVHYWDSCAPLVVLEASGGRITQLDLSPLSYAADLGGPTHQAAFVATNGLRHDDVCRDLAAALAAGPA